MRREILTALAVMSVTACANAAGELMLDPVAMANSVFRIRATSVEAPVNIFLLVRRESDVCAIRFTEIRRGHDARRPTTFDSGAETTSATYEWIHFEGRESTGKYQRKATGQDVLVAYPLKGIGRFAFQTGKTSITCGPLKVQWIYPMSVSLRDHTRSQRYTFEIAPTKWRDGDAVDPNAAGLRWYRAQDDEREIVVKPDDL